MIYHLVLRESNTGSSADVERINRDIHSFEKAIPIGPNPVIESMLADKRDELKRASSSKPVSSIKLAQELANQGRDFIDMLDRYRSFAPTVFTQENGASTLAKTFLIREMGKRRKRRLNLESMGLVATAYPGLEKIQRVSGSVSDAAGFDVSSWRDFLKICLDFFVRGGGSLSN